MDDQSANLIKKFEGLRTKAYQCPAGKWTIGYGHTGPEVHKDVTCTAEEADRMLQDDINKASNCLRAGVDVPLNPNQWAALISFIFNVGSEAFYSSTLRQELNRGNYIAVPFQLRRWNKATDPQTGERVVVPGLMKRRIAEAEVWLGL
jgi:lysozyme